MLNRRIRRAVAANQTVRGRWYLAQTMRRFQAWVGARVTWSYPTH